ncbi:hypothetical protein HPB48_019808 [Haemaphysalis longicornis]|uniref:Tick transposon n=1 Tax=Haemaphysalis longicornis TaxID=44386 RepID=A0A9J6GDT5_HAELO|nr:hypothetical protein HPB48_019808 [Haemaphysalis longicornis]
MCMLYTGATSQWNRRTRALATKYEVPLPTLNDLKGTSLGPKALREQVCAAETRMWEQRARSKPALRTYSVYKTTISREGFYDNSRGSSLLEGEVRCAACGEEEEFLEHVVLECGGPQASEANGGGDDAAVDIASQAETTKRTKRRLENWFAVGKKRCGVVG